MSRAPYQRSPRYPPFSGGQSYADGVAPIWLNGIGGTGHPFFDVLYDGDWIFAARIIRGHNDIVATPSGDLSHQWTLATVAVATATKYNNQLSRRDLARRFQEFFQRIVGMRIIDDDAEWLALDHRLKPSRHIG